MRAGTAACNVCHFGEILTLIGKYLIREIIAVSQTSVYNMAQTPTTCNLQPRLNFKKDPYQKLRFPLAEIFSATTSQFLVIVQQDTWSTIGLPS